MKKTLLLIAAALFFAGCGAKHQVELIPAENFNTEVDGKPVSLYTLHGRDITMQVTNFGARVVSLWTPDKNGSFEDVVLGYNNIEDYVHNQGERFLGAVVGPYANRIAGGTFTVGDQVYNFPLNNNGQTLHGGLKGVDMLVWDVCEVTDSSIVLNLVHPDGLDGFATFWTLKTTLSSTIVRRPTKRHISTSRTIRSSTSRAKATGQFLTTR